MVLGQADYADVAEPRRCKRHVGLKNRSGSMQQVMNWPLESKLSAKKPDEKSGNYLALGLFSDFAESCEPVSWKSEAHAQYVAYAGTAAATAAAAAAAAAVTAVGASPGPGAHPDKHSIQGAHHQNCESLEKDEAEKVSDAVPVQAAPQTAEQVLGENETLKDATSRKKNSKKKKTNVKQTLSGMKTAKSSSRFQDESSAASELFSEDVVVQMPKKTKKAVVVSLEELEKNHRIRRETQRLIKQKWRQRRLINSTRDNRTSRELATTTLSEFYGKPPFSTFGDRCEAPLKGGVPYNYSTKLTHNITPELYPNEPEKQQVYDSAVEKALIARGSLQIGCKERLHQLKQPSIRRRILHGRKHYNIGPSFSSLVNPREFPNSCSDPGVERRQNASDLEPVKDASNGFFVSLATAVTR